MKAWHENHWYWELAGRPVLLLGGSDADNLFNRPSLSDANLGTLKACGGNYIRCTLSSHGGGLEPYELIDGKYDLYRFNRQYWERLEGFLHKAASLQVVVQLELWSFRDLHGPAWLTHPFNPANNLNFSSRNTTLLPDWPHDSRHKPQPYFLTVPELNDDPVVLGFQQAFVDKVLEVALRFENVLFCIDAESWAPPAWAFFWAGYMNSVAAEKGVSISLTESWGDADVRREGHLNTYSRSDLFSYVDISPNNLLNELEHWDRIMWVRKALVDNDFGPRPINNIEVFATGASGGLDVSAASERFWQNVFAGCASSRLASSSQVTLGLGLNANAQKIIAAVRAFTNEFDIFRAAPSQHLLLETPSTGAYCSAVTPDSYAVYFPDGGQTKLDLSKSPRAMNLRWFDPRESKFLTPRAIRGGRQIVLVPPDLDMEWAAIIEKA